VSSVAGASNFFLLTQRIEDVRTFAGQQATLSFWAKADASKNIAIEFFQTFGTGGSPSAGVDQIGTVKKALTTSWQKITQTVTIPSISGKTIGTDDSGSLRVLFWFDAGSNFNARTDTLGQQSGTFDIAQVQLEAGPVATPFERRPIGTELALCQRYFCVLNTVLLRNTNTNFFVVANVSYPVIMRSAPTSTYTFSFAGGVVADQDSITTAGRTGSARFQCRFTSVSNTGRGSFSNIKLDAEL
jgi:hypothetical protein